MATKFTLEAVNLSEADRKALCDLSITANLDNPYGQVVWGHVSTADRQKGSYARYPVKLLAEGAWFLKLKEGDKVIATAEWELPAALWKRLREEQPLNVTAEEQKKYQEDYAASVDDDDWPIGARKEAANAVGPVMREGRAMYPQNREYILLDQLKTSPEHRRRGAASQLLKWGIDLADREGLPICLTSWPLGLSLYEKCGFRKLHEVTLDLTRYGGGSEFQWVFMIREPTAS